MLFTVTNAPHYEDVQPRIIVPVAATHGTTAVVDAVLLNLAAQGFVPRVVQCEQTYSYDRLFRQLWGAGEPFILVEHDIVPWPGALAQLWSCPEPWCGYAYHVHGELRSYLGCTKFDPSRLGPVPLPAELVSWLGMDRVIEKTLMTAGHAGHRHGPPVSHLNFTHGRMTDRAAGHPRFWAVGTV